MIHRGDFLGQISLLLGTGQPFVLFRVPGQQAQVWLQKESRLRKVKNIDTVINSKGFLFHPYELNKNTPLIFLDPDLILHPDSWSEEQLDFSSIPLSYLPGYESTNETKRANYLNGVHKLINRLSSAEAEKVVISRTVILDRCANDAVLRVYSSLEKDQPLAFTYLAHLPPYGTWLGATPETLIDCNGNRYRTMALAGTRTEGTLNWGTKEIEEQAIVSRFIENILQNHEVQNLKSLGPSTMKAGMLEHLCTTFEFQMKEPRMASLLGDLHPTPAVCGLPRDRAKQLIHHIEEHPREYYTGFLGPINTDNRTQLFVNLRCMKITPSQLVIYTGGGITRDSVAEKEWEETSLKSRILLSVIEKNRNLAS